MDTKTLEIAISSGALLGRRAAEQNVSVLYPINVRGMLPRDAFEVPHTEAAMHYRAAGGQLLAWAQHRNDWAGIVWSKNGTVGYIEDSPRLILSKQLREFMEGEKAWTHGSGNMRRGGGPPARGANFRRDITRATFVRKTQDVIHRLVQDQRLTEGDAEELVSRHSDFIEELLSARVKAADIARQVYRAAYGR